MAPKIWTATSVQGTASLQFTRTATTGPPAGKVTCFPIPDALSVQAVVLGPDGNLWFTETTMQDGGVIGYITAKGNVSKFALPLGSGKKSPHAITVGPDGNLWFTEDGANNIGRITPAGTITEFPIPKALSPFDGLTVGPDHNLWFIERGLSTAAIARITQTGMVTEFPTVYSSTDLDDLIAGPDGNVWYVLLGFSTIARITPTGAITNFFTPTAASVPFGLTRGADGAIWFIEGGTNKFGRITHSGDITEFPFISKDTVPIAQIFTLGPDGNLWLIEGGTNRKIARITMQGTITEFPVLKALSFPDGLMTGPDGNLWFTEHAVINTGAIERLTPTGIITEFSFNTAVSKLTKGPGDHLWFVSGGDPLDSAVNLPVGGDIALCWITT